MGRIILAFLLLALAVLLTPQLREKVQPEIDTGREWLGAKLEGPLSPILNRYRTLKTQSAIEESIRNLIRHRNVGHPAPEPGDFAAYLTTRDLSPTDAWGIPLLLEQRDDSLAIMSAGPDLIYWTQDDMVSKIRYPALRRSRSRRR